MSKLDLWGGVYQFREINYFAGRHVGDQLLNRVAARLSRSVRSGDVIARTGGDEFAILFADDVDITTARARDLRAALSGDELTCFYQPKIRADDGRAHSVEALLRWQHPRRGLLLPEEFLPTAERAGLMRLVANAWSTWRWARCGNGMTTVSG